MKHFTPPTGRRTRQALLLSALLAATTGAHAAGTASGTVISNTATLSYSDGVSTKSMTGSASFTVDNKVDVLVTGNGSPVTLRVVPGATEVETTFTVKNDGNTSQDFALNIVSAIAIVDDFDPTACTVSDVTGAGTYTANDQHINALAPDSIATVTVICNIPTTDASNNALADGKNGLVALVATAREDNGTNTLGDALSQSALSKGVNVVFADGAGSDDKVITGVADGLRDASHSARNTYKVTTAVLSITKSVATVCDPFNGTGSPKNIPGALVRWSIEVRNAGSGSATLAQISDALDPTKVGDVTFDEDFEQGSSAATCLDTANVFTSASGKGFRVSCGGPQNSRACASAAAFFTSNLNDDAIGHSSGAVSVNFNGGTLAGTTGAALPAETGYQAGELKKGETVTVEYQMFVK